MGNERFPAIATVPPDPLLRPAPAPAIFFVAAVMTGKRAAPHETAARPPVLAGTREYLNRMGVFALGNTTLCME